MTQPYSGSNPFTPLATPSGLGIWPTPLAATGGDERNAANLMAAVQAMINRGNWLGHRTIDWRTGGLATYTLGGSVRFNPNGLYSWSWGCIMEFTGQVTVNGSAQWYFYNSSGSTIVGNGATFSIGKTGAGATVGHLLVTNGSDINVNGTTSKIQLTNGADFEANNGSVVSIQNGGSLSVDSASSATMSGPTFYSGSNGWQKKRHHDVSGTSPIIDDGRKYDLIECANVGVHQSGGGGTSMALSLAQPPDDAEVGVTLRVYAPQGIATGYTSSEVAFITVSSPGVGAGGQGWAAIDGSGKTVHPCFVDLEIVEAAGGTQRKWVATAVSAAMPVPT